MLHDCNAVLVSAAGAALPSAGAAPAAGAAPTPEPTLLMRSLMLQLSRALGNNYGQYGSTSTPAAFKVV